jgi:hypothetical protein
MRVGEMRRYHARAFIAKAEAEGKKAITITADTLICKCRARGCDGEIRLRDGIGIDLERGNLIVYPCPKCKRVYDSNGTASQIFGRLRVCLTKGGKIAIKNNKGKTICLLWTSAAKPIWTKPIRIKI